VEFLSLKLTAVTLINCIILCSLNSQESMSYTNHLFNSNSNNIGTMSIKGVKSVILIVVAFWIFIGWPTVYGTTQLVLIRKKIINNFWLATVRATSRHSHAQQTIPF